MSVGNSHLVKVAILCVPGNRKTVDSVEDKLAKTGTEFLTSVIL